MDQRTSSAPTGQTDLDDFLGVKPPSRAARLLKWAGIALVVLLALWLVATLAGGSDDKPAYAAQPVTRGDLRVTVSATGNLQPINQVDVGSELSGTVTQVGVDNNDRVRRGQVLARLDPARLQDMIRQSQAALAAAQAGVAQAQATERLERAELARLEEVRRLSGGRVPAPAELDAARAEHARAIANVRAAQAAVAQARAQLSSDQTQLGKAIIRSPVHGVVLARQVEPGQTVAASLNAPVLFTIAEDLAQMQLEVKVDEADVGQVAAGQRATFTVDAFPGRSFAAQVKRVDVGANAGTTSAASSTATAGQVVSYTAILTVANPDLTLRPGMTATAEIVTAEKQGVLLVPNAALRFSPESAARAGQNQPGGVTSVLVPRRPRGMRGERGERDVTIGRGSQQTVYVLGADDTPQPVPVTVGDTNGRQTEVRSDRLRGGMRVITGQLAAGAAGRGND